jgi:hypothetical protein
VRGRPRLFVASALALLCASTGSRHVLAAAAPQPYTQTPPVQSVPAPASPAPAEPASAAPTAAPPAPAPRPAPAAPVCPGQPLDYMLTMTGGGSRGAYQAGFAYALASKFRQTGAAQAAPATSGIPADAAQGPLAGGKLLGLSGVSVGAINAVMTAVAACAGPDTAVDDNPLWSFWRDIDWDRLFPGDRSCSEFVARFPDLNLRCGTPDGTPYTAEDGVFSMSGIQPLRRQLQRLLTSRGQLVPECRVPVVITLATDDPGALRATYDVGSLEVPSSRRFTGFVIQTTPAPASPVDGSPQQRIQVCDLPLEALRKGPFAQSFFGLPHAATEGTPANGCRPLSLPHVIDALVASVAQPPLFEPQPVTYCAPTTCEGSTATGLTCGDGDNLCEARFSDGAAFDRKPVSGAVALQDPQPMAASPPGKAAPGAPPAERQLSHVIIDPLKPRAPSDGTLPPEARGIVHLARQADNFFAVSGDLELQMLSRYGALLSARVDPSTRYTPIVGDLQIMEDVPVLGRWLSGTASFLNVDFRRYDYYVGLYDGVRWIAEQQAALCPARVPGPPGGDPRLAWQRWLPIELDSVGTWQSAGATAVATYVGVPERSLAKQPPKLELRRKQSKVANVADRVQQAPGAAEPDAEVLRDEAFVQKAKELAGPWKVLLTRPIERGEAPQGDCGRSWKPDPLAPDVQTRMFRIWDSLTAMEKAAAQDGGAHGKGLRFEDLARHLDRCGSFAGKGWARDARPEYIGNYDRWQWNVARFALQRIEKLERTDDKTGTAAASSAAAYLAAIQAGRRTTRFSVGPTTVPDRLVGGTRWGAWATRLLLPATLTGDWHHGGIRVGWEPLAYGWSAVRLFLTAQYQWQRYPAPGDGDTAYGALLGFGVNGVGRFVPDVGLRAGVLRVPGRAGDFADQLAPTAEIFYRPLWSRVELYGAVRGSSCMDGLRSDACGASVSVGFGLADVNGLIYWVLHSIAGEDETYASLGQQIASSATGGLP